MSMHSVHQLWRRSLCDGFNRPGADVDFAARRNRADGQRRQERHRPVFRIDPWQAHAMRLAGDPQLQSRLGNLQFPTGGARMSIGSWSASCRIRSGTSWSAIPSRCWQWIAKRLFARLRRRHSLRAARGRALRRWPADHRRSCRLTFNAYNSSAMKHFKMISALCHHRWRRPKPYVDIRVDYDYSPPLNQPDVILAPMPASTWDVATWDQDYWAAAADRAEPQWNGVASTTRPGGRASGQGIDRQLPVQPRRLRCGLRVWGAVG